MTAAAPASCVHLRLHSEYDIQKGAARLAGSDSVIDYAAELEQPALALTDSGGLFGAIKFYRQCHRRGIKPIIGCELAVADGKNSHSLLLLCASHAGYVNLNRLLSRLYRDSDSAGAAPQWMTPDTTEGLVALSGGRHGDIGAAIERAQLDIAEKRARGWMARFPDRFYIEVWRGSRQDSNRAAAAADLAHRLGLPVAATHPVQCTRPKDKGMLETKLCIAAGHRLADPRRPQPLSDRPHLLSAADMRERFADLPGALDNSADIARRCNLSLPLGKKTHLPSLPQKGALSSADLLKQEAKKGLDAKLPPALPAGQREQYKQRLDTELGVINKMEFADYFLIVMDFIRWAKRSGIPVGPGRGSGAGSLVAYALDITTLDPLSYDLLFERFLNPERISMPDFDIDFCVNGRDEVIRYVKELYGQQRVSQIVTFGTIGAKGAVRDAGRVQGMPNGYCDRLARMVPGALNMTIEKALKESPEFAAEQKEGDGGELIARALEIEGLPRSIGTHAGGVLIAPRPMEEFCPQYAAPDTQTLVSQYDMGDIEDIGLVKFDFLGLRTLTILADAEREVRRQHDPDFDLETLPLDDRRTYQLYGSGHSIGVFQCESIGLRELMKKLRPDRFTDLIALVALYRPGPLNADMDKSYIARKHGKEEINYPHELLESVLADTYGLFIYQEQVMEIARRIGGYSLGQADILRRAMGKKDEKQMASMRESFVEGSKERMDPAAAQKLFNDMAQFAEYGFNKSHAAAYALLSYRTAYIKAHYPAIFLAAVLSAEADSTDRVQLLFKDARRLGIEICPPDINDCEADFRAIAKDKIRFGLKAIKGIGGGVIDSIVGRRAGAPFQHLFDFCARAAGSVPAAMLELLVQAGAFDPLHKNRAAAKATVASALAQDFNAGNLFEKTEDSHALADVAEWGLREKLEQEQKAIGFPLSGAYHQLYRSIQPHLPLTWRQLAEAAPRDSARIAGCLQRVIRRGGQKSGVFILEDESGEIEVQAPFPEMKVLREAGIDSDLLIAEGRLYLDFRGNKVLAAQTVQRLDAFLAARLKKTILHCAPAALSPDALQPLLPRQGGGGQHLLLRCEDGGKRYDISLGSSWTLGHEHYLRLRQAGGIGRVSLEF